MTVNNPTYSTEATAKRGAARANLTNYRIDPKGERFELINLDTPLYNADLRKRSNVKGAVGIVWDIAAEMLGNSAARKDIIAACVDAGVNINTARTQYQAYRKAAGLVKS